MHEKTCPRCGVTKSTSEYYAHNQTRDRLAAVCKTCHKARGRENAIRHALAAQPVHEKHCLRCDTTKPIAAFNRARAGTDAYGSYCRVCTRDYRRERYGTTQDPNPRTERGATRPLVWRCPSCKAVKPVADYFKDSSTVKGFQTPCKSCMKAREQSAEGKTRLRKYYTSPKGLVRSKIQMGKRSAWKHAVPATFTREDWAAVLAYFDYACVYCGSKSHKLTQDHLVPVSAGGAYTAENIVPACLKCNMSKNARPLLVWAPPTTIERILAYLESLVPDSEGSAI